MSATTDWQSVPERGALLGMRFVARFYRRFGKRAAGRLLLPILLLVDGPAGTHRLSSLPGARPAPGPR